MMEKEWLTCAEPLSLLGFLRNRALIDARKMRLLAVACARRQLHGSSDTRVATALEVAERFADGLAENEERAKARRAAQEAAQARGVTLHPTARKWERRVASLAYYAIARDAAEASRRVLEMEVEVPVWRAGGYASCDAEAIGAALARAQLLLLRDLVGNPFRPIALGPSCRTPNVMHLAHAAYQDRELLSGHLDPARLAVLSDALEEAGCTEAALLDHLRSAGPHVRGCFAVDLLLEKD